ncbi:Nuclear receptor sub 2 group E member 1 [Chamberlinius hualienensis]
MKGSDSINWKIQITGLRRSIRRSRQYVCKARSQGSCPVDKTHRNQCRACRLKKCLESGMNKDAVQHERGPRNSTIRRQVALYLKDNGAGGVGIGPSIPIIPVNHTAASTTPSFMPETLNQGSDNSSIANNSDSSSTSLVNLSSQPSPGLFANGRTFSLCQPIPKYPHQLTATNLETIRESAARLIFLNVKWAKSVPAFTSLHHRDQLLLMEEAWRELFVLSAAQFFMPIEGASLLAASGLNVDGGVSSEKMTSIMAEIRNFQEIISNFRHMRVDATEYACLKAIVLFKTVIPSGGNELRCLRDHATISTLQDQAQLTLCKYIQTAYPTQPFRFGKLLLMLPAIQSVNSSTIEHLFFKKTIGSIPIERLICDMYRSNDF